MRRLLLASGFSMLVIGSTFAQQAMPDRDMTNMDMKSAMRDAMQAMPKETGDADVDFMKHMRPHHQAAIDMAKVVIANGKDPEVKKLAQDIVTAQEKEIATIDAWLKKKGS